MMLRMRMLPILLPEAPCRRRPRGVRGGGRVNYEVSCEWRFQPPNTLLKQEGLQLAEASFRDNGNNMQHHFF